MKLISLSGKNGKGLFAKVDDADFDWLNQWRWHASKDKYGNLHAVRESLAEERRKDPTVKVTVMMHRQILGAKERFVFVDHADHDKLNNTRSNLRLSTPMQNSQNRTSAKNSSSKFLGVSKVWRNRDKKGKNPYQKYSVAIRVNKKLNWLGDYPLTPCGEILAALAYDKAAQRFHGEFANLNFKPL